MVLHSFIAFSLELYLNYHRFCSILKFEWIRMDAARSTNILKNKRKRFLAFMLQKCPY